MRPNDKFRFECVSQQWKRTIHERKKFVTFGSTLRVRGVDIEPHQLNNALTKISTVYSSIYRLQINTDLSMANKIIEIFPNLKELTIGKYSHICEFNQITLPNTVVSLRIKSCVSVDGIESFNIFMEKFSSVLVHLDIEFDFLDICEKLIEFKRLKHLSIYNSINMSALNLFATELKELKYLQFDYLRDSTPGDVNLLYPKFAKLKQLSYFYRGSYINMGDVILAEIKESIKSLDKRDFGYIMDDYFSRSMNISVKDKIMILSEVENIDWLANNGFNDIKTLALWQTGWPEPGKKRDDFYKLLINSSINTLIMDEFNILQCTIDIFIKKAFLNPNEVFVLTNNFSTKVKYQLSDNLFIFLTMAKIENNKIVFC